MSTTDQSLVASLARAQGKFEPVFKRHTNPHFGSKYADLSDIFAAVIPALSAEGIAFVQTMDTTEFGCVLVGRLLKGSEEIVSVLPLDVGGKAQEFGSRLTYFKRYQAGSLFGVAAEDDDDGNAANDAPTRENVWQGGTRYPDRGTRAATPKQIGLAVKLLKEVVHQNQELAFIEEAAGRAAPPEDLTLPEMSKLIDALNAAKKAGRTPTGEIDPMTEPF